MDVSEILSELNDHGFEDTASSRKVAILNDTIADVCSREPWPFLEKEIRLTFNGTDAFPSNWPDDFSKEIGIHSPDSSYTLKFERWEVLRRKFSTALTTVGTPTHYYFVKNRLSVYPIPGASDRLDMEYICWHPEITEASLEADILVPARHHRALIVGTLLKLYAMEDDPELSALFKTTYDERLRVMREDLIRVSYDTDNVLMFEDDYLDSGYY